MYRGRVSSGAQIRCSTLQQYSLDRVLISPTCGDARQHGALRNRSVDGLVSPDLWRLPWLDPALS